MSDSKHENYEILNLIGYGLAKFNLDFVKEFGFKTKTAFYDHVVTLKIAETRGTVKNRQDLFDPFFNNGRKGWWQKDDAYIHRKILIDSLFGDLNISQYTAMVKIYIQGNFGEVEKIATISPVMKSRFKQLQITGQEAELYFMHNYKDITIFSNGTLDDARLFGDGYDFQIQVTEKYFLAEIKGVRASAGAIRLTENEFTKANEYKSEYGLIIISNLAHIPKMTAIFNPIETLALTKKVVTQSQTTYHSEYLSW